MSPKHSQHWEPHAQRGERWEGGSRPMGWGFVAMPVPESPRNRVALLHSCLLALSAWLASLCLQCRCRCVCWSPSSACFVFSVRYQQLRGALQRRARGERCASAGRKLKFLLAKTISE